VFFNSLTFLIFLAIFLVLYFASSGRGRLWICLLGSYTFYGWWDYRFLALIVFSTLVDYWLGMLIDRSEEPAKRKSAVILSCIVNLGFLGFFKYFNFFIDSFQHVADTMGLGTSLTTLDIILPVGISFYTFQSMSYTIDVYRRQLRMEPDLLRFATFIAFFPQLVAGPIVRARDFLPQLHADHPFKWDNVITGTGQVLAGYFKKVVVADGAALVVDRVFDQPGLHTSIGLSVGVFLYAFQIYCDFSGYSDIAIGLARVMGFEFPENFRTPYISKSFSEFWQRWHISLSSWLRDYLYIPLGGNRNGAFQTYRNLLITMLLGGLWHGADWKFVIWGGLHGLYLVVQRLIGGRWQRLRTALWIPNWLNNWLLMAVVFTFTCVAWVFFRASSAYEAWDILGRIVSLDGINPGSIRNKILVGKSFLVIGLLLVAEEANRRVPLQPLLLRSPAFCVVSFATMLWLIALLGVFGSNQFIYFQF
jgi:D-alanyl-lipoteichoic acid acyltransferase DltB (MBOAT superfamily)